MPDSVNFFYVGRVSQSRLFKWVGSVKSFEVWVRSVVVCKIKTVKHVAMPHCSSGDYSGIVTSMYTSIPCVVIVVYTDGRGAVYDH